MRERRHVWNEAAAHSSSFFFFSCISCFSRISLVPSWVLAELYTRASRKIRRNSYYLSSLLQCCSLRAYDALPLPFPLQFFSGVYMHFCQPPPSSLVILSSSCCCCNFILQKSCVQGFFFMGTVIFFIKNFIFIFA